MNKVGLFLSGGGARGAYQAGALKALADISIEIKQKRPFEVITGVSSGAINAVCWAAYADDIQNSAKQLTNLWETISMDKVLDTSFWTLMGVGMKWATGLTLGTLNKRQGVRSLVKTDPLRKLLDAAIPFENIQKNIELEMFRTIAISALQYANSKTITFVQGKKDVKMWRRHQRESMAVELNSEHVMASSAIPIIFPNIKIDGKYHGDGSLRNLVPLSPAIRLGAEKLIIVGVGKSEEDEPEVLKGHARASVARVASVILNSILMDAIGQDIEALCHINNTLNRVPQNIKEDLSLKVIDFVYIRPSKDIGDIAMAEAWRLPKMIRFLLRGLGSLEEGSELVSYLLFDSHFCKQLIDLGYHDCMAQKEKIIPFLLNNK